MTDKNDLASCIGVAKIAGTLTSFIDHIPADQDHESAVWYYVLSHDEVAEGIWIPGDYREVVTRSPKTLLSDTYGIVTVALPTSPKGKAYETIKLMKNSGSDPVSWKVSAGTLPAGLTLSANGIISGTPTSSGTYTFTATVTDALAATASKPFTLVVTALPTLESVIHEHQNVVPGGTDNDH
jgi:Putative Ig domain